MHQVKPKLARLVWWPCSASVFPSTPFSTHPVSRPSCRSLRLPLPPRLELRGAADEHESSTRRARSAESLGAPRRLRPRALERLHWCAGSEHLSAFSVVLKLGVSWRLGPAIDSSSFRSARKITHRFPWRRNFRHASCEVRPGALQGQLTTTIKLFQAETRRVPFASREPHPRYGVQNHGQEKNR